MAGGWVSGRDETNGVVFLEKGDVVHPCNFNKTYQFSQSPVGGQYKKLNVKICK